MIAKLIFYPDIAKLPPFLLFYFSTCSLTICQGMKECKIQKGKIQPHFTAPLQRVVLFSSKWGYNFLSVLKLSGFDLVEIPRKEDTEPWSHSRGKKKYVAYGFGAKKSLLVPWMI